MKKKHIFAVSLMLCLMLTMFVFPTEASAYTNYEYRVGGSSCNIRKTASTSGESLGLVSKGALLGATTAYPISEYSYSSGKWTKVYYNGGYGYINNPLICPAAKCMKVTTSAGLNIRSTSDPASPVQFVLGQGEYARTLSQVTPYYHYILVHSGSHRGSDGYCSSSYWTVA